MGGSFMAIPQQSKHPDAAWDFVKYALCTAEGQNTLFKNSGIFPAYKPAWKDPLYDQPVEFYGGQKAYRLYTEIADKVPGNTVSPNERQASDIVGAEVTKVEKQGKDPAKAMADAETEATRRIRGTTK
jgi:multiple sugar transport system substrate-binding protein